MTDTRLAFDAARTDTPDHREIQFHPADPSAARTLDTTAVEAFNADGFVSGLTAFEGRAADDVTTYFDALLHNVLEADDRRNSYSINAYELVCRGIYDLILEPVLLDHVQDLLGPDFVCWGSHLFCKLPGDPKEVPLHQDATYWPFTPTHSVTVWLALDDTDEENGAMTFAPGSHLHGALPHDTHALDGTRVLNRAVSEPDAFPVRFSNNLRRGQFSIHNDLLLHGSQPNQSDRRRAGFTIRYAAAEVDTLPGWDHWKVPAQHCRGVIPDHWPNLRRPSGEHPERMAEFAGDFDGQPLPDAG